MGQLLLGNFSIVGSRKMDGTSAFAIFVGAGCGALLRWGFGTALDPLSPAVPLGTLAANVLGGLLMGIALGVFAQFESLPVAWRLAVTTGFLGGLTTFSAYSAEAAILLLRADYRWASVHLITHVAASLLATLGGLVATQALFKDSLTSL